MYLNIYMFIDLVKMIFSTNSEQLREITSTRHGLDDNQTLIPLHQSRLIELDISLIELSPI